MSKLDDSPAVRIQNLTHRYQIANDSRAVLDDVSLSLNKGETVALLGMSGSGKSTLLNLISGLDTIQAGQVHLFDQNMRGLSDKKRTLLRLDCIGFVYQAFNLIPTLTVAENISLPLALKKINHKEQKEKVAAILSEVGLPNRGGDYPDKLSGGEQQRVALARAIVHRPPLLLADEPTGNLDAHTGRQVLQLLNNLVRSHNCALLLVTHSIEVAAQADRTLTIEDGVLRTFDTTTLGSAW